MNKAGTSSILLPDFARFIFFTISFHTNYHFAHHCITILLYFKTRKMISVCQEKLIQIKEQETRVNRLQLELESLHISGLNSKQLKRANDAFEIFAKVIFRIYIFFQFIVSLCLSGFFTKLTIIFISTKIIVNADKILKSNISTDQSCQNKKNRVMKIICRAGLEL